MSAGEEEAESEGEVELEGTVAIDCGQGGGGVGIVGETRFEIDGEVGDGAELHAGSGCKRPLPRMIVARG